MRSIRKQHVILLEVLIAMSLMSILIVSVLGFYYQFEGINQEITIQRRKAFYELYLQSRLGNSIPFASPYTVPGHKEEFTWFYSSFEGDQPSLIFVFDNDVHGTSQYSKLVLGKIYIDPQKRMILAIWPLPNLQNSVTDPPPIRKEILFENVETLTFSFYHPARRDLKKRPVVLEEETPGWSATWEKNKESIPPLMKITVKALGEPSFTMPFAIVQATQPILYQTGEPNQ